MSTRRVWPTRDLERLTPYQFKKLPSPEHLRILAIHGAPEDQEVVSCTLETLEDAKNKSWNDPDQSPIEDKGYEALSWCWGEGDARFSIRIREGSKDYSLKVTEHLYEALCALRMNGQDRHLWIDAICINQEDTKERNQQVAKMNEVYGDASSVCIWLGKADDTSKAALAFIENELSNVYKFDQLCRNRDHIESWAALLDLMKKPWFSRRWVVQEVSLAQRATVYCGRHSVSWERLGSAISLLADVDTSVRQLSDLAKREEEFGFADDLFKEVPALGSTSLINITNRLFKRSIRGKIPQRTSTLEDIVARLAMFESTEPRDTIYALLALAKDSYPTVEGREADQVYLRSQDLTPAQRKGISIMARVLPPQYRQRYNVDYDQCVVDVYQQFVAFAISRADPTKALDIICRPFAQEFTRGEDIKWDEAQYAKLSKKQREEKVKLPSWIANRREVPWVKQIRTDGRAIWSMERQRGDPFVSTPDSTSYCAAGSRKYNKDRVRFRKRGSDYSMFVEGFVLDVVSGIRPASQLGNIPPGWVSTGNRYQQDDPDTFWKTLVADRSRKGHAPFYYKNTIETVLKSAPEDATFDLSAQIQQSTSEVVSDVIRQVQATIWNRRLIETGRGHLGLAPPGTRKGDIICIIYGCSVPVILRKCPKTAEQIDLENKADEDDRLERRKRLEPKIESLISKVKARYREKKGVSIRRASWLAERAMFVSMTSFMIFYFLGQQLAACMLLLLPLPHLWIDYQALSHASNTSRKPTSKRQAIRWASLILSGTFGMIVSTAQLDLLLSGALLLLYTAAIPELLPRILVGRYLKFWKSVQAHVVKWWIWILKQEVVPPTTKPAAQKGPVDPPPLPQYCTLVGECYVHKMMNGEAIELQNLKDIKAEIFELR